MGARSFERGLRVSGWGSVSRPLRHSSRGGRPTWRQPARACQPPWTEGKLLEKLAAAFHGASGGTAAPREPARARMRNRRAGQGQQGTASGRRAGHRASSSFLDSRAAGLRWAPSSSPVPRVPAPSAAWFCGSGPQSGSRQPSHEHRGQCGAPAAQHPTGGVTGCSSSSRRESSDTSVIVAYIEPLWSRAAVRLRHRAGRSPEKIASRYVRCSGPCISARMASSRCSMCVRRFRQERPALRTSPRAPVYVAGVRRDDRSTPASSDADPRNTPHGVLSAHTVRVTAFAKLHPATDFRQPNKRPVSGRQVACRAPRSSRQTIQRDANFSTT